jgi:hypothetical protein
MHEYAPHITAIQQAARNGHRPHQLLHILLNHIEPAYPGHTRIIPIERCLMHAFAIPLHTVRDIEQWQGFSPRGNWTDHDVNELLDPWIRQYLEQCQKGLSGISRGRH